MDGPSALLLLVLATFGPNGHFLLPALTPRGDVPSDAFLALTPRLWVVFHDHREWPMAFYQGAAAAPDASLLLLAADPAVDRALPRLRVPRIFLYAPVYRPGGRLPPAGEMPLDVAQYFFGSLLEALFDLDPPDGLEEQAAEHGASIPESQRRTAYTSALAEFGSHAMSVAVELARALERQRAAGKDPCRVVDLPATLFGLWGRMFTVNEYRGQYRPPGGHRWVQGPPLSARARELFVRDIFGGLWTGDVRRDFDLDSP